MRGWQVGYEGIVGDGFLAAMSIDENEGRWQAIVDGQVELQTLVAVVDDRLVGFASMGPYRSEGGDDKTLETTVMAEPRTVGELYGFYVHPDSWVTGVANELHERRWRLDATWATLTLWVLGRQRRARRFDERHGWTADGKRGPLRSWADRWRSATPAQPKPPPSDRFSRASRVVPLPRPRDETYPLVHSRRLRAGSSRVRWEALRGRRGSGPTRSGRCRRGVPVR